MEGVEVDAEADAFGVGDAPGTEDVGEEGGGDEGAVEVVVEVADVVLGVGEDDVPDPWAAEFEDGPEVGFGEVGVVEADGGDAEPVGDVDGAPAKVVGVARFDDVGLGLEDHFFGGGEVEEETVA
ncbi:MAG: hypothetical protein SNJ84_05775 [Verrucomicrobiia bacterium]